MKKLLFIFMFLPFIGFGQCVGDCQNGYGNFTSEEGTYKGYWKDGRVHGNGIFEGNEYTYDGEYLNGKQHGQGKKIWNNGKIEEGLFSAGDFIKAKSGCVYSDCKNGYGAYEWPAGDKYSGNYKNGQRDGFGTYTWANGDKYVGNLKDNEMHGQGTYTWANGNKWNGKWKNNTKNGYGTQTWADGDVKTGIWISDEYQEEETTTFKPTVTPSSSYSSSNSSSSFNLFDNLNINSQIGFISNLSESPFGINYIYMPDSYLGFYLAFRSDFGVLSPGEWGLRDKDWLVNDMEAYPTGIYEDGGHDNYAIGITLGTDVSLSSALIIYSGITLDTKRIYEKYEEVYTGPYYAKSNTESKTGLNVGLILQTEIGLSYQIGYDIYEDQSVINFGIGINWDY
jgi:hypothetical protein